MNHDFYIKTSGADPGFGQGGAPASEALSCWHSKAESREWSEPLAAGVQGPLKGLMFVIMRPLMFNAQICILQHSRDSFSLISDIQICIKPKTLQFVLIEAGEFFKLNCEHITSFSGGCVSMDAI